MLYDNVWLAVRSRPADHSRYETPRTVPLLGDGDVSAAHDDVVAKLQKFSSVRDTDVTIARQKLEDLFYRDVDAVITDVDAGGVAGDVQARQVRRQRV